jgi:hypothetical protein
VTKPVLSPSHIMGALSIVILVCGAGILVHDTWLDGVYDLGRGELAWGLALTTIGSVGLAALMMAVYFEKAARERREYAARQEEWGRAAEVIIRQQRTASDFERELRDLHRDRN